MIVSPTCVYYFVVLISFRFFTYYLLSTGEDFPSDDSSGPRGVRHDKTDSDSDFVAAEEDESASDWEVDQTSKKAKVGRRVSISIFEFTSTIGPRSGYHLTDSLYVRCETTMIK